MVYTFRETDDRELRFERLREKLDDVLPEDQYRSMLIDMALVHLDESIDNHREFEGDPRIAKQFRTSVISPKYRTWVDVNRV